MILPKHLKEKLDLKLNSSFLYKMDFEIGFLILCILVAGFSPIFLFLNQMLSNFTYSSPSPSYGFFIQVLLSILVLLFIVLLPTYFCIYIDHIYTKVKSKTAKEYSLFYKLNKQQAHLSLRFIIITAILFFLNIMITFLPSFMLVCIIADLLYLCFIIEKWIHHSILCHGISEIASGNLTYKIAGPTASFYKPFNELNHISDGIAIAFEEKLKSERLKTDLVANVSHDLRTPLTSIINYVGLLEKLNIKDKKANEYIKVLENKSEKLKNLTDDLIEISKVTSGNEPLNLEEVNLSEIVLQANGEFAEKLEKKKLIVISNVGNEAIMLMVDPKKMWRVLENVYTNISKYSLERTRVYIDLVQRENTIIFTAKNISKEKLNIPPEELMERFVRVDSSRNTSGNGLGLAIAKNLVELHSGKFEINIQGDLFMVTMILPSSTL